MYVPPPPVSTNFTPEQLAAQLNKIEPFAVRFGYTAYEVTLSPPEARALIRWIEHYIRVREELNNDSKTT